MKKFIIPALLGLVNASHATSLTVTFNADDFCDVYISSNDSTQGTLIVSKNSTWQTAPTPTSITLSAGTHYLHIRARDAFGAPSMLLGLATLSDSNGTFVNGTQSLVTNTKDWNLSLTGFGQNYFTPIDLGADGTQVWQDTPNIPNTARHIWSQQTQGEHYFSTKIEVVPEPATMIALSAGLLAMRRRRR